MKKYRYILYFLICCIFLSCFCGCNVIFKQEFSSASEHIVDNESSTLSSGIIAISDYDMLKQRLYSSVKSHSSSLTVKLSGYSGDVERDVHNSIAEVMKTSLAVYGVSSITYESTLILSYYEVTYNITYSRTQIEFYEINEISSVNQLRSKISDCLTSFGTEATFQCDNLDLSKYDLDEIILNTYYSNPIYAIGLIDYEINYYPELNENCILKVVFNFSDTYAALTTKRLKSEDALKKLIDSYSGLDNEQEKIKYFHDSICEQCAAVQPEVKRSIDNITPDDSYTIYGALVNHEACSFGYSLALQALCNANSISGMLISGSANGSTVQWNMVFISDNWYHVDCCADDIGDGTYGYGTFCVPDRLMSKYYVWSGETRGYCVTFNVRYNYDLPDETKWLSIYNPSGEEPDVGLFKK